MQRQIRGRQVGYDDRGRGAPVVLLHPFPFARDIWGGLTGALEARFRVIAVDARGFGESSLRATHPTPGSSAPYAITDLADDLAALLDALEVPRAALLGMSMGGYTALAFAARHAVRLTALVLADTRAAADSPETRAKREAALSTLHGRGAAAYLEGGLVPMLSPGAPEALRAHVRASAETREDSLVAGIEALRDRPDRTAELGGITCPTLVVCGSEDVVSPPAEMRRMSEAIGRGPGAAGAGARYVELPGAGHLSHLQAPELFTAAVTAFLAGAVAS
jgi:pimeloyl-ACP methyl ester carboxylesterase